MSAAGDRASFALVGQGLLRLSSNICSSVLARIATNRLFAAILARHVSCSVQTPTCAPRFIRKIEAKRATHFPVEPRWQNRKSRLG